MASLGEFDVAERQTDPDAKPDTFTFCGETFEVARAFGALPLLKFAAAAERGLTAESFEGMAAIYELIRSTISREDWGRFEAVAIDRQANVPDLLAVTNKIYGIVTGHPTSPPGDSTDGSSDIGASSPEDSSSDESSSPIQHDPRVRELVPVDEAARQVRQMAASA